MKGVIIIICVLCYQGNCQKNVEIIEPIFNRMSFEDLESQGCVADKVWLRNDSLAYKVERLYTKVKLDSLFYEFFKVSEEVYFYRLTNSNAETLLQEKVLLNVAHPVDMDTLTVSIYDDYQYHLVFKKFCDFKFNNEVMKDE